MGTYDASIQRARQGDQQDLIDHAEHCSADPRKLASVGAELGHQVRVRRSADEYALFTVSEVCVETPDSVVRMGRRGRCRLGTDDEFSGVVDTLVTTSELTDEQARAQSEFVERLQDNGHQRNLIVLAPHGGDIEPRTDEQAEHVAARLGSRRVSAWLCRGYQQGGGASSRWHITSDDIDPESFPALRSVFGRGFAHAVSFHGFIPDGTHDGIVVGGAAPDALKDEVAAAICRAVAGSAIPVRTAGLGDPLGGGSARNIVNRITANGSGGVQIEQSPAARDGFAPAIADAVADVYDGLSRRGGPAGAMVRRLCQVARSLLERRPQSDGSGAGW